MKFNGFFGVRVTLLGVVVASLLACSGGEQDQAVADFSIAYIKRPVPTEVVTVDAVDVIQPVDPDVREAIGDPDDFVGGGDVYIRERASASADERNITLCLTDPDENGDTDGVGTGDVRDLETSYDGTKLIFSLRLEDFSNGDDVPKWNVYEYDAEVGGCPTPVIEDLLAAAKGDDVAPHYLPDGRIVFSSNASVTTREVEQNAGKFQFSPFDEDLGEAAVALHVMNADGTNIKQISFNPSHDLDASVLSSGEIVFSRWDGARGRSAIRLYTIHPDGTELKALYGLHNASVGTGGSTVQFLEPREVSSGRVLAMLKPFVGSAGGGAPVVINVAEYSDINRYTALDTLDVSGPGQVLAINQDVRTDGSISPAGRYRSVYPLADGSNRALVSWSQCRLQPTDPATGLRDPAQTPIACPDTIAASDVEAFPLYGIYVYDFTSNTQLPIVIPQENIIFDEPVVLAPRTRPTILVDKAIGLELDEELALVENVGILHIRSVYDFDGTFDALGATRFDNTLMPPATVPVATLAEMSDPSKTNADERPARYLRIIKAAAIIDPQDDDNPYDAGIAFGRNGRAGGMREIIGYAPIEPDGSVMVKVPANMPLSFHVVDKDGRSISSRHLNWIQVQAGEILECGGCHTHTTTAPALPVPHGYSEAPTALNSGAPTGGGMPAYIFPNTNGNFPPEMGETMAQARIRVSCSNAGGIFSAAYTDCAELNPSPNPVFFDLWAQAGSEIPDVLDLRYGNLDPVMAAGIPATPGCTPGSGVDPQRWEANCRTIINYEDSIQPIWELDRNDKDGNPGFGCLVCHSNKDAVNADVVPAAQLDLRGISSNDDTDVFMSYRELLFADDEDEVNTGAPSGLSPVEVDQIVQRTDPITGDLLFQTDPITGDLIVDGFGDPIPLLETIQVRVPVPGPVMNGGNARGNPGFFNRFTVPVTPTADLHEGLLTPAELRLLYEWLDVGAQYFNNTLDAPA